MRSQGSGAMRVAGGRGVEEPVYEVGDVAVQADGSVRPVRRPDSQLAAPERRSRDQRRSRLQLAGERSRAAAQREASAAPAERAARRAGGRPSQAARSEDPGEVARGQARREGSRADGVSSGSRRRGMGSGEGRAAGSGRPAPRPSLAARASQALQQGLQRGHQTWHAAKAQAQAVSTGDVRSGRSTPESAKARRWLRPGVIVAVALVLVVAFLYPAARDLYHAQRDHELLSAQAAALQTANDEALARVQALSTEDGIKDEARLHGYVEQGEEAVDVTGLPEQEDEAEATPVPSDLRQEVLDQEDPWYVQWADVLFGYQKGSESNRAS